MAAADVRTLWSAFVRVLLRCVAALGFGAAGRTHRPAGTQAAAGTQTPAGTRAMITTQTPALRTATGKARRTVTGAPVPPALRPAGSRTVPAPRNADPYPYAYPYPSHPRRGRDHTLPPTMKQRIRAEAHGATPTARSVLAAGEPAAAATTIPAPRPRAHEARCE